VQSRATEEKSIFYFVEERLEFLRECYMICHMTGSFLVIIV